MRWPTATGLWLAFPVWVYAVLAVLELRDLGYDPTDPTPGYVAAPDQAPTLVWTTAAALGVVMLLAATGRLRRVADGLLGLGLLLGGWMLWTVEQPRPVAPVVVAVAGILLTLSAALPAPREPGRVAGFLARLLLATAALVAGWVVLEELADHHFQLHSWTVGYWAALALCSGLLLAALLGPHLAHPVWRRVVGLPLLGLGLLAVVGGIAGLREGYLVSGHEETEDGWRLGGAVLFTGAGWVAAAVGALRGRWVYAAATTGSVVVLLLALLFGVPEIRKGF